MDALAAGYAIGRRADTAVAAVAAVAGNGD